MDNDQGSHYGEHHVQNQDQSEETFGFPILDIAMDIVMKKNPPSILPQFDGMPTEDPDAFLFEFQHFMQKLE